MLMRRWGRRARWCVWVLAAAAAALLVRVPQEARGAAQFPRTTPHALAHALADFSAHPRLDPHIGAWTVEEEAGNYTWWRYAVRYACGARCEGRAVLQHEVGAPPGAGGRRSPRHGPADEHRLLLADSRCTRLPLLPWPWFCDDTEVETSIEAGAGGGAGGGARLRERARGSCGALHALLGRCDLRERRARWLRALQEHF
ncbi:uncharacterized protein [Battus philenor]|uniref:uncharacterized protein n=1 Tax=Battus philenor TaxID=42288 RepID=UPI0035CF2ACB